MTWSSDRYFYNTATATWPVTISNGYIGTLESAPAPREPTALEWLDAEVEKTCALAR